MRYIRFGALAALLATLLACDDGGPLTPGEGVPLSGTWAAASGSTARFGAVTLRTQTVSAPRDMLAEGASIVLDLRQDGTTSGRLFIPAAEGVEGIDADLAGTWTEEDGIVRLDHAADTVLRDMTFSVEDERLVGEAEFGGVAIEVALEPVSHEQIEDLGSQVGVFEVEAAVDVAESFPVELTGTMTFSNPDFEPHTLVTGVCWPLLRAYDLDQDVLVWDQLEEGACALFTPQVDVIAAGGSKEFQSPTASASDILDDDLPDGRYRITVYFSTVRGGEIEIEAGEVELAIPRVARGI